MVVNFAHLRLAFGLLGNVVSFMVFLSPLPTFYQIYKRKSSEGFQSVPYVVGLFSAMLWIYYALLKTNVLLLITINTVGVVIQTFYICVYLFYAQKKARMESMKLIVGMIFVGFGLIVILTEFLVKGVHRAVIVGWICLIFSLCVFVAPLGILRKVIKTKSVEYMPVLLSVFLTLSAVMWFFYGLLLRDINIAVPNILGFTFGIIQIIFYFIYKNKKPVINEKTSEFKENVKEMEEQKIPETKEQQIITVVKLSDLLRSDLLPAAVAAKLNANIHDFECVVVDAPLPHVPNHTIEVAAAVAAKLNANAHDFDRVAVEAPRPHVPNHTIEVAA